MPEGDGVDNFPKEPCEVQILTRTSNIIYMENEKLQWKFEKLKGDYAVYAFCPKCDFHHSVGDIHEINRQYRYCPMCGEYLYVEGSELEVVWNERDIVELYQ